ncbi:hypothetical protein GCM10017752_62530 [Streptomyces roseoviridis]
MESERASFGATSCGAATSGSAPTFPVAVAVAVAVAVVAAVTSAVAVAVDVDAAITLMIFPPWRLPAGCGTDDERRVPRKPELMSLFLDRSPSAAGGRIAVHGSSP